MKTVTMAIDVVLEVPDDTNLDNLYLKGGTEDFENMICGASEVNVRHFCTVGVTEIDE